MMLERLLAIQDCLETSMAAPHVSGLVAAQEKFPVPRPLKLLQGLRTGPRYQD